MASIDFEIDYAISQIISTREEIDKLESTKEKTSKEINELSELRQELFYIELLMNLKRIKIKFTLIQKCINFVEQKAT